MREDSQDSWSQEKSATDRSGRSGSNLRDRFVERTLEKIVRQVSRPPMRKRDLGMLGLCLLQTLLLLRLSSKVPQGAQIADLEKRLSELTVQLRRLEKGGGALAAHRPRAAKAVPKPEVEATQAPDPSPSAESREGADYAVSEDSPADAASSPATTAASPAASADDVPAPPMPEEPTPAPSPVVRPSAPKPHAAAPRVEAPSPTLEVRSKRPEARPPADDVEHVVKEGETLWEICERYYNDATLTARLIKYNHLDPGDPVQPGLRLRIPIKKRL